MNRSELIERIRAKGLDRGGYWLVAGGAMVLYGLREETADIDLGCTSEAAEALARKGVPSELMPDGTRRFALAGDIEAFENWIYDRVVEVDGIPVVSLAGLMEMKLRLGRPKDIADAERIRAFIENMGSAPAHRESPTEE